MKVTLPSHSFRLQEVQLDQTLIVLQRIRQGQMAKAGLYQFNLNCDKGNFFSQIKKATLGGGEGRVCMFN